MSNSHQKTFHFELRPAMGYQDFMVTICNREAVQWLDLWPDWKVPAIVIYGSHGCGKSHLANVFVARSGANLVTPLMLETTDISKILGDQSCCVVDDAESGFDEEIFLHLYNCVESARGHMLLTATKPPSQWGVCLKDLESRLKSIPSVKIGQPDDKLLEAVLAKLFSDRQLIVGSDVISYVLNRMERSLTMAQEIVERIDKYSLTTGRKITLPLVRQVFSQDTTNLLM